jgi:serine/threonine-protein kinase
MALRLTVIRGPAGGLAHTITGPGTALVGRSSRAQFQFPSGPAGDLWVSHAHALVEYNPPVCRVYDLNSNNGTYVNGVRVNASDLKPGDVVKIGHSFIRVSTDVLPETVDARPESAGGTFDAPTVPPARVPSPAPKSVGKPTGRRAANSCPGCRRAAPGPGQTVCPSCHKIAASLPQTVPGYLLLRLRGRGGMGEVYKAVREADGRLVALKMVVPAAVANPSQLELKKFLREADILRRLHHPNIVSFQDLGAAGRTLFLAMDYVRGQDVGEILKRVGPFPQRTAVRVIAQVLLALDYAHAKGFVHRDVKPSNVMLKAAGKGRRTVKVTDFGLARVYHESQKSGLTLEEEVGGTAAYLPPEQIVAFRRAQPPADQYSTAATLYNLLTDRYVYDFRTPFSAALSQILDEDPVPIRDRRADVPEGLARAVHRALSRDPRDRFPTAGEFRKALLPFAG